MILIVDLCWERGSLSRFEFVHPVSAIVEGTGEMAGTVHLSDLSPAAARAADGIVLCGTAIKDHAWQGLLGELDWLRDVQTPVLGICAGSQLIAALHGGEVAPWPVIGMQQTTVLEEDRVLGKERSFEAYHLHNLGPSLPPGFTLLAGTGERAEAFRHTERQLWGVLFHPEVRNEWIVENFVGLCRNGPPVVLSKA